jgi:hypothetical protein
MNQPDKAAVPTPCVFCGCTMRIFSNRDWHHLQGDHEDDCPFDGDEDTMCVPATIESHAWMIAAWNRRAQLEARPAEGVVNQRIVVCAANRQRFTGMIAIGPRHYDETMRQNMTGGGWGDPAEQGFIDQWGEFMTREEAWKVAEAAGQIRYRCGGDGKKLFSENLY